MGRKIFFTCILLVLTLNLSGCFGPGINDYSYLIANDYMIVHSSSNHVEIYYEDNNNTEPNLKIPSKVTKIAWNNNFILAEQTPLIAGTQDLDRTTVFFWIIDVLTGDVYGPLSKDDFESKRDEFHIDSNLELENPEKFKYLMDEQNK